MRGPHDSREQSTGFLIETFPGLARDLSGLSAFRYYKEDQFLPLNSPHFT